MVLVVAVVAVAVVVVAVVAVVVVRPPSLPGTWACEVTSVYPVTSNL